MRSPLEMQSATRVSMQYSSNRYVTDRLQTLPVNKFTRHNLHNTKKLIYRFKHNKPVPLYQFISKIYFFSSWNISDKSNLII